jgi:hypothetical protein
MGPVSAERMADDRDGAYGWSAEAVPLRPTLLATVVAPEACLIVRAARITAGAMVTLLGVTLLVLPGPGVATIAAGLSILSIDVPQAQRLLQRVRDRLPQDADGGTPSWLVMVMGAGLAVSVVVSVALMIA